MAERAGFEPAVPCGTPDFESGTFDHSATSPVPPIIVLKTVWQSNYLSASRAIIIIFIYALARSQNLIFNVHMIPILRNLNLAFCTLLFLSCNSSKKLTSIDFSDGSYAGEVNSKGQKTWQRNI